MQKLLEKHSIKGPIEKLFIRSDSYKKKQI